MSFSTYETSRSRGRPVNLYFFRWGSTPNSYHAYTDAENEIIHDGITYEPVPVMRGAIVSSGTLDKAALEIRMPLNLDFPSMFLAYPPPQVVTLTIRQGHLDDTDAEFLVVWTGRVISTKREGNEAVFQGEPVSTSMRRNGLRRHYQYTCPHVLYGPHCRANEAAATSRTTVSEVYPGSVVLASNWIPPGKQPEHYIGGILRWTGQGLTEIRTILRVMGQDNRTLELSGVTRNLSPGQSVEVILGCNRQMSGCQLHNNIQNFGGFPWIPKKNPVGYVNNYY